MNVPVESNAHISSKEAVGSNGNGTGDTNRPYPKLDSLEHSVLDVREATLQKLRDIDVALLLTGITLRDIKPLETNHVSKFTRMDLVQVNHFY